MAVSEDQSILLDNVLSDLAARREYRTVSKGQVLRAVQLASDLYDSPSVEEVVKVLDTII